MTGALEQSLKCFFHDYCIVMIANFVTANPIFVAVNFSAHTQEDACWLSLV